MRLKMEAISFKEEYFEREPHGMPMFRAQITVPTSALSMTHRQEKVGLCKLIFTPTLSHQDF